MMEKLYDKIKLALKEHAGYDNDQINTITNIEEAIKSLYCYFASMTDADFFPIEQRKRFNINENAIAKYGDFIGIDWN